VLIVIAWERINAVIISITIACSKRARHTALQCPSVQYGHGELLHGCVVSLSCCTHMESSTRRPITSTHSALLCCSPLPHVFVHWWHIQTLNINTVHCGVTEMGDRPGWHRRWGWHPNESVNFLWLILRDYQLERRRECQWWERRTMTKKVITFWGCKQGDNIPVTAPGENTSDATDTVYLSK